AAGTVGWERSPPTHTPPPVQGRLSAWLLPAFRSFGTPHAQAGVPTCQLIFSISLPALNLCETLTFGPTADSILLCGEAVSRAKNGQCGHYRDCRGGRRRARRYLGHAARWTGAGGLSSAENV